MTKRLFWRRAVYHELWAFSQVVLAEDVLGRREWPGFPPGLAITRTPVFVGGGRLLAEPASPARRRPGPE
jgi:hypothetical protein